MTGLTTIEKLLPELLRGFPAISIFYVFGSTVTGACDGESDVDVAAYIDDRHGQDPLLDLRIGLWLQDRLGCPVDVVIMNNASAILRHEIVRTGVRLYERAPAHRAENELRAFKEYLDMRHFQQKRHRQVAHG